MVPAHFWIWKTLPGKLKDTKINSFSVYQSLTSQERNWRKCPIKIILKVHLNKLNQECEFLLQWKFKILKKKLNKILDNGNTFHASVLAELILWKRYITKTNLHNQCNSHKIPITFFIELEKSPKIHMRAEKQTPET